MRERERVFGPICKYSYVEGDEGKFLVSARAYIDGDELELYSFLVEARYHTCGVCRHWESIQLQRHCFFLFLSLGDSGGLGWISA